MQMEEDGFTSLIEPDEWLKLKLGSDVACCKWTIEDSEVVHRPSGATATNAPVAQPIIRIDVRKYFMSRIELTANT
ncbi:hypothetical protein M513_03338 [Trichuris suis]|uniref:Uncharacterized protein n=1 Tax=Trichuris suis TaxID=68888 RepID=A0A085MFA3_9BILA|nr:hypothetical protein M513_03338 [Trichuris suis]